MCASYMVPWAHTSLKTRSIWIRSSIFHTTHYAYSIYFTISRKPLPKLAPFPERDPGPLYCMVPLAHPSTHRKRYLDRFIRFARRQQTDMCRNSPNLNYAMRRKINSWQRFRFCTVGQVRYWSLTSLNITQMISDRFCTARACPVFYAVVLWPKRRVGSPLDMNNYIDTLRWVWLSRYVLPAVDTPPHSLSHIGIKCPSKCLLEYQSIRI